MPNARCNAVTYELISVCLKLDLNIWTMKNMQTIAVAVKKYNFSSVEQLYFLFENTVFVYFVISLHHQ